MVDELHALYREGTTDANRASSVGQRYALATGGAVHKNPLLCRLIEEQMGLPTHQVTQREVAAVGAAWLIAHLGKA